MYNDNILMGVIMTTDSDKKRFSAMKQLFDIGKKILKDPLYIPKDDEFTDAENGIVALYNEFYPKILYKKNSTQISPTMSITKIMTILSCIPYVSSICHEKVTIKKEHINNGSGNFFTPGDILTIEDILYGMLLPSSNTCAAAFADYIGKKILDDTNATFTDSMNAFYKELKRRASIIGCNNSIFLSASGIDLRNVSTCEDMLKILTSCTRYPEITNIWNKKSYTIEVKGSNPRLVNLTSTVQNENLEKDYFIIGGKTGSAGMQSLRSLVMIAKPV